MKTWTIAARPHLLPTLLLTTLLLAVGCGDIGDDPAGPGNNNQPAVLTWEGDIVPNVITPLGCVSCHGASLQSGGLNLTNFASWIDATSNGFGNPYVADGDPSSSELVWRLEGSNGVPSMPPTSASASTEQIDLVKAWINDGAFQTAADVP